MDASERPSPTARLATSVAMGASFVLVASSARAQAVYETNEPPPSVQPEASVTRQAREPVYEGAHTARYEEGDPVPRGYYVVQSHDTGLIVGGAVLFGSLYAISLLTAAGNADATARGATNPAAALYIPVIGPFAQMTRSANSAVGNVFLAVDGVGQTAGMLMLVAGFATTRTALARGILSATRASEPPRFTATAAPLLGPGISGMCVAGTF